VETTGHCQVIKCVMTILPTLPECINYNYFAILGCSNYIFLFVVGNELCLLSEGISALPHDPPPSLMQAGVLPRLLLDPYAPQLDYLNVAAVIRRDGDEQQSRHECDKNQQSIQNSLQSFRVVTNDS
jgi:hypothetical protein